MILNPESPYSKAMCVYITNQTQVGFLQKHKGRLVPPKPELPWRHGLDCELLPHISHLIPHLFDLSKPHIIGTYKVALII